MNTRDEADVINFKATAVLFRDKPPSIPSDAHDISLLPHLSSSLTRPLFFQALLSVLVEPGPPTLIDVIM